MNKPLQDKIFIRTQAAFFAPDLSDYEISELESLGANDPELIEFKDTLFNINDISLFNQSSNPEELTLTTTSGEKYTVKNTKKLIAVLEQFMLNP